MGEATGIGSGDRESVPAKHLQQSRPTGITGEQPEQSGPCAEAERGTVGLRNEGALTAYVQDDGLARVDIPKQFVACSRESDLRDLARGIEEQGDGLDRPHRLGVDGERAQEPGVECPDRRLRREPEWLTGRSRRLGRQKGHDQDHGERDQTNMPHGQPSSEQ